MPVSDSVTTTIPAGTTLVAPAAGNRVAEADTAASATRGPFAPADHCLACDAPLTGAERAMYSSKALAWRRGVKGTPRGVSAGTDPQVMGVIVGVLVLIALNMRHVKRLFRNLPQDLWSLRRRANAFDEHTANESRTLLILLLQVCVFAAVLLYMWLSPAGTLTLRDAGGVSRISNTIGHLCGLAVVYYVFQLAAFWTLGYAFTDPLRRGQLLRGLNASTVLLGQLISVPALVALFYPSATGAMLAVSAACYAATRAVFVAKGWRVFYRGPVSLVYFALYFCCLEIILPGALITLARGVARGFDAGFMFF